jgi:hypothetical protein
MTCTKDRRPAVSRALIKLGGRGVGAVSTASSRQLPRLLDQLCGHTSDRLVTATAAPIPGLEPSTGVEPAVSWLEARRVNLLHLDGMAASRGVEPLSRR